MTLTTMMSTAGWLLAAAASVPADGAENRRVAPPAGGLVAPGATGTVDLPSLLAVLRADAAQRSGVDPNRVTVHPAEEVVWSDGALGCPQPGLSYTQALVPGWRVRVDVPAGAVFSYHTSRRGEWLLCPAGRAGAGGPAPAAR